MSTEAKISDAQKTTAAIVTLASDIGSIYSIINASDYNSEIFIQAKISKEEATKIAYKAEEGIFDLTEIKKMVDHLSQLANSVYKKRAHNPLISDQLISTIKKAMIDTENVVALTVQIKS
ncbi:MAG: hypothetical protein KBC56_07380 [Flavobacterium sp.]|nr:hypothetical protein [Flavobacterium sp.]